MRQYRFFWHRSVVALPIAILFGMVLRLPFAYAQDIAVETLDELQAIRFEGCVRTQPADLLGVLSSRESELSFTRQLAKYYYENVRLNPSTPQGVLGTLATVEKDLANELRYFSEEKANSDSLALLIYLWQNGFHNAKVDWSFTTGSTFAKNTLTFRITEGEQAIIDTFLVVGLDSVASEARKEIEKVWVSFKGSAFSELRIDEAMRSIVRALRNNGYYRAQFDTPIVRISRDGLSDSVLVRFHPGRRVRIGDIVFEENAGGYPSVSQATRKRQLEFDVGDLYSERLIELSRGNLMGLSVFDLAAIDTVQADFIGDNGLPADSLLAMRVFTKNSKNYDVGANLLLFQTQIDNYLNAGAGVNAVYQNPFGGAQVASAELQYVLQDVSSVFQGANLQSEALAALRFSWPTFAKIEELRLGAQLSATYSFRLLIDPFRLESFTLGARLPVNLFSYTYFNGFDLNVSVERQIPRNFATALDDALDQAQSEEEIAYILSTFSQFEVLDAYLRETGDFFTGVYTGVNLRGEHRDNPVNPRSGTFASISTEFGWGAGKFVRLQFFNSVITPVNPTLVLATKVKVGHIQLLDFQRGSATDTNTYVPLERQFFAGGAASIRSFASRTLHDPSSGYIDIDDALSQSRLSNVIGSGSLVELGFEARFTFSRPRNLDDVWATMIERSGITLFTDIGNSFNRLTEDLYGKMRLQDLWQGSVVAAGIGYRFDTPVGPFRIDYATSIYDPTRSAGQVIWNGRENVFGFNNWLLSIGLGHAF